MNTRLIYDTPANADLFYATRFWAPDAIIFIEKNGKKYLFLSDLEVDRGRREAKVDAVEPLSRFVKQGQTISDIIVSILKKLKIRSLSVPHSTSFALVDHLRKKGIRVSAGSHPFYEERTIKSTAEKKEIERAQKNVFASIAHAEEILRQSKIKGNRLTWRGKILTSEQLRYEISRFLLERGYNNNEPPIVACGIDSTDPHSIGSGPLKPHTAIIVDVFPRSMQTGFYGDSTRTFCKGRAPDFLRKQYALVKEAQEMAIKKIRAGVNGKTVHQAIQTLFTSNGFKTGTNKKGLQEGFFHGTGHGIGLDLHEEPVRINSKDFILKPGHVVTVEPGLYYRPHGGVRIEDIVYVTKTGCEILSHYPKRLEIP